MPKPKCHKKKSPKRVLALPDLERAKTAVLNSLTSSNGQRVGDGMSPKVLWDVRPSGASSRRHRQAGAARSSTNLRQSVPPGGGELDQIQFLLGHVSVQTTERYLGCNQKLRSAVNDRLGIEPDGS